MASRAKKLEGRLALLMMLLMVLSGATLAAAAAAEVNETVSYSGEAEAKYSGRARQDKVWTRAPTQSYGQGPCESAIELILSPVRLGVYSSSGSSRIRIICVGRFLKCGITSEQQ